MALSPVQVAALVGAGVIQTQGGGVSLPIAPAIDTPIVTGGVGAATFATQTSHAPRRIGDNTTNVDQAGDTKFRYPGVPDGVIIPNSAINARFNSVRMPGGVAQARNWDMAIETVTDSKFVGFDFIVPVTSAVFLIVVNGKVVDGAAKLITTGAGTGNFILLEFPDRRSRRVKLIYTGSTVGVALKFEAAYPPVRPTGNDKVLLTIGDSLSAGANGVSAMDTWPQFVALMLGFDHCCNASIGGTRWVQTGVDDVAVSHFGGGRLAPALTTNPSAVVFAGSRNDSAGNQAQLDAVTAAVVAALDATPISKRFVSGTFTSLAQNAAVKAGADAKGVTFIDMTDGLQADDLAGGDGIHPVPQGAVNLRNRFAPKLFAAGCKP